MGREGLPRPQAPSPQGPGNLRAGTDVAGPCSFPAQPEVASTQKEGKNENAKKQTKRPKQEPLDTFCRQVASPVKESKRSGSPSVRAANGQFAKGQKSGFPAHFRGGCSLDTRDLRKEEPSAVIRRKEQSRSWRDATSAISETKGSKAFLDESLNGGHCDRRVGFSSCTG